MSDLDATVRLRTQAPRPMPSTRAVRWHAAAHCHPGVRRQVNEDALIVHSECGLWAVADGMGGHAAGDVASQAIVEMLGSIERPQPLRTMVDLVEDLLCAVNARLREHATLHCAGRTVGSTVVTMVTEANTAVALWAGDSRLYRLRGDEFVQVTRDHNPVADLLDDGLITESTALKAETNVITRAVGGEPRLALDVIVFEIVPWDTYLLCSDGLYRELAAPELANWLRADDVQAAADGLLAASLARGARDNVSLIVLRAEC
jgi:protein phosphatase